MKSFDEIYLLDLHGNSLKKEACPDGSKDEDVFDIRQGVAIAFFVKQGGGSPARVCHADRWGLREDKYDWLTKNDVESTGWHEFHPQPESYLFVPQDEVGLGQYKKFISVTEVLPFLRIGMNTHRDQFSIDFDRETLKRRIRTFLDPNIPDQLVRQAFDLKDNRNWKMSEKRVKIQEDRRWEEKITQCLYRPFDTRWIFYHYHAIDYGREDLNSHFVKHENLGLVTTRQTREPFAALAVDKICGQHKIVAKYDGSYVFPLYLYSDEAKRDLLSNLEPSEDRKPNLSPKVLRALGSAHGKEPAPEEILHYMYAILYAETYRQKYAEFLKTDFPRIPFTADFNLFRSLTALGKRLVDLHLLRSEELDPPAVRFQGQGDNQVAKTASHGFCYEPKEERVYINKSQYFEPVAQELWEYQIGGYQVLSKWLKDRKERRLTLDKVKTYCHIATALQRTIALQEEIDALYPGVETRIVKLPNGA